jgi:hypothetical protein
VRYRLIRIQASHKAQNDVWLSTDVLDPALLTAQTAARFYRYRWQSEICQVDYHASIELYLKRLVG